jgi:hypothetical protein
VLGRFLRLLARGVTAPQERPGLTELAQRHGTDKWGRHHRYTPHYERHLAHLRDRDVRLLEIGVGGYGNDEYGGASLRMWKAFFPRGRIFGIDIEDKSVFEEERIRIFRGSQVDEAFLAGVLAEIGTPDVIIDDGSHVNAHMVRTFEILFQRLAEDGVYVVEDTQTAYWPRFGGHPPGTPGPRTFMDFVKERVDGVNHPEYRWAGHQATPLDLAITGVHCYHNLVFFEKGRNAGSSVADERKVYA